MKKFPNRATAAKRIAGNVQPKMLTTCAGTITVTGGTTTGTAASSTWTCTLTRTGNAASYGGYTVVYTQDGFDDGANSTIPTTISPVNFTKSSGTSGTGGTGG